MAVCRSRDVGRPGFFDMRHLFIFLVMTLFVPAQAYGAWEKLAPGMDFGTFAVKNPPRFNDCRIIILRIDPKLWQPVLIGRSGNGASENKTARQWCESHKLTAAINAGMFATDYRTHVGYLASNGHVNSSHVNKYMSVAAFGPKKRERYPEFRIFDLDDPQVTMADILRDFSSVVQNLRLIKRPGENRWRQQDKKWSEAALGEDRAGRMLFIFTRSPFSMHDFNRELLSLGIGLVAAQHLEGGPEAQLYLRIGNVQHEMFGSYKTLFNNKDGKTNTWPIPNVLGVRPRVTAP
jgi:hypothetical protein